MFIFVPIRISKYCHYTIIEGYGQFYKSQLVPFVQLRTIRGITQLSAVKNISEMATWLEHKRFHSIQFSHISTIIFLMKYCKHLFFVIYFSQHAIRTQLPQSSRREKKNRKTTYGLWRCNPCSTMRLCLEKISPRKLSRTWALNTHLTTETQCTASLSQLVSQ